MKNNSAIIKEIKDQMTDSCLTNIQIISKFFELYSNDEVIFKCLLGLLKENFYYEEARTKLVKEVCQITNIAKDMTAAGKFTEAIDELMKVTAMPDFYAQMGHAGVDCRNDFEYQCFCARGGNYYKMDIHYSHISYLIGSLFLELGEFDQAFGFLQNSINWNEYNSLARLEFIEAKIRQHLKQNKKLSPELINEIRQDLKNTHRYIYRLDEFTLYLRKNGFLLIEEERFEEAKYLFELSLKISDSIGIDDKISKAELLYIDNMFNGKNDVDNNAIVDTLKSLNIYTHLNTSMYLHILDYCNMQDKDSDLCKFLTTSVDTLNDISGLIEIKLVSVVFENSNKTYDYICGYNDVKIGDKVVVIVGEKQVKPTVVDVKWIRIDQLPLDVKNYKRVIYFYNEIIA